MKKSIFAFCVLFLFLGGAIFLSILDKSNDVEPNENTQIYLYGETHGKKKFFDIEVNEWEKFYKSGCRNLFVELPFYSAEFLNIWMKENNDQIIDQLMEDWKGSPAANKFYKKFFKDIKQKYPETIFYGTDVGHQYETTGQRYLDYLVDSGLENSEKYASTLACIEQGKIFYNEGSKNGYSEFRESCMVENFIKTYDQISDKKIMGIYGSFHTQIQNPKLMSGRLQEHYGKIISSKNVVNICINPKPYTFGFSYIGLIFLLMLFIPNIIWTKNLPENYELYAKNENKFFVVCEKIGQVLATVCVLIFSDFNFHVSISRGGFLFSFHILFLVIAFVLMILYDLAWIKYFKSQKKMDDFYKSFMGFPLALATLPVLAFLILGIYGKNLILIFGTIILGIGHIGIHRMHQLETKVGK